MLHVYTNKQLHMYMFVGMTPCLGQMQSFCASNIYIIIYAKRILEHPSGSFP